MMLSRIERRKRQPGNGHRTGANTTFNPCGVKKMMGGPLRGLYSGGADPRSSGDVDLQPLDLLVEGGRLQTQQGRGPALNAVGAPQALGDDLPLEALHRLV